MNSAKQATIEQVLTHIRRNPGQTRVLIAEALGLLDSHWQTEQLEAAGKIRREYGATVEPLWFAR